MLAALSPAVSLINICWPASKFEWRENFAAVGIKPNAPA
jgi:hypothetical protein